MSQYKDVAVGSTVYFWFAANTTAGAAGDGATPLYDVRLAGAGSTVAPTASGTPTLLTHANYTDGLHEIAIDTTGYSTGSEYAVFCTLTISSVNPAGFVGSFVVRAAASTLYDLATAILADTTVIGTPAGASIAADLLVIDNFVDGLETTIGAAGAGLTALGDTRLANLDAAVTSRMATYTQPTGFLAATFPTTVASTTNITAAAGITLAATATSAQLVDDIWDEVLSAATHNVAQSAGKRVRQMASNITHSGTAQSGGSNFIILDTGASTTNGMYEEQLVVIDGGTGVGQAHHIVSYEGATRKAWIDDDWKTNPDLTSTFILMGGSAHDTVAEGVAQAGGASSITLESTEPTITDIYKNCTVIIVSGTGFHQVKQITAYNGTSKVATVDSAWGTQPDTTSCYYIYPIGALSLRENTDKTGYSLTQTFPTNFSALAITAGGIVDADIESITGDTGSATKLERVLSGNTTGTVGAASTTTSVVTSSLNPAASVTDQFKGLILKFDDATTTAALRGQGTDITASTAGGILTVTALTTAPVSGDIFTIS